MSEHIPRGATSPDERVNILLVDDSPAKLLTYEIILGELQVNVIKATSADEAIAILLVTDVALVLTDVAMPGSDGFELAKCMRQHPRLALTPIVFVSATAHSDLDRLRGYTDRAVDYLTAPVIPELLRAKVKVFIDLHRRQRELENLRCVLEARVAERTAALEASAARLAQNEQRYRMLVDNANDIVATFDLEGRFTSVNRAVERVLGYKPEDLLDLPLARFVPPDEMPMHETMRRRKLDGESSTRYEMHAIARDGRSVILEVNSTLIFNSIGEPVGVHSIARDVTERKEAEARQAVLIRELQHRTRNLLSVMQSIITNTLARSADLATAKTAVLGRLHALARAQDFIAEGNSAGVRLRDLVELELAAFAARLTLNGIPLLVDGRFAQQFALVIHELATNAAKYGALSTPTGRVIVSWEIIRKADEAVLQFSWVERDGPPVRAPTKRGFGSDLIAVASKMSPGMSFKETGLEFSVDLPLSEVIARSTAD
jgi:PAS domain S-box-containing protein